MKATRPILAGVAVGLMGVFTATATIMAQNAPIAGSKHDFSTFGWSNNQICLPCHTPHSAVGDQAAPLWNRAATTATYTLYGGGSAVAQDALDSRSLLCMSCHDGTVALDSFGGKQGSTMMQGSALVGTDLSNDHPVGATAVYPVAGTWGLNPANTWEHPATPGRMQLQNMEVNGQMVKVVGCTTCHNVHNTVHPYMLRQTNDGSNLCLRCHIK